MTKPEIMQMANALIEELLYCDDADFVDMVCNAIGWGTPFPEEEIRLLVEQEVEE